MKYQNGLCSETNGPCHLMDNDCDFLMEYLVPSHWEFDDLVAYALWYAADEIEEADSEISE